MQEANIPVPITVDSFGVAGAPDRLSVPQARLQVPPHKAAVRKPSQTFLRSTFPVYAHNKRSMRCCACEHHWRL